MARPQSWWPFSHGVEQLEDLDTILNEPPPLLPLSSSSPFPAALADSPQKAPPEGAASQQHDSSQQATAADSGNSSSKAWSDYLPSVAGWLPSSLAAQPHAEGHEHHKQQQQQEEAGGNWPSYLPAPRSLIDSFTRGESSSTAPQQDVLQEPSVSSTAAPGEHRSGDSHNSGTAAAVMDWAVHTQHQLSSACHSTGQRLAAAGSTALGMSVLGAAVGGVVAGPLGMAAGAKSGAALVAAGAVGGAAVKRYALGADGSEAAHKEVSGPDQELQALSPRTKSEYRGG